MPEEELESYPEEEEVVEEGGVELEEKTATEEEGLEEAEKSTEELTEIEEVVEYSKVDPELIEATLVAADLLDSLASGKMTADEVMKAYNEKVAVVAESKIVKVKGAKKSEKKSKKTKKTQTSKRSQRKGRSSRRKSSS